LYTVLAGVLGDLQEQVCLRAKLVAGRLADAPEHTGKVGVLLEIVPNLRRPDQFHIRGSQTLTQFAPPELSANCCAEEEVGV
jgi:hypothetical protein